MPKHYGQACPVAKTLEIVGDRWTLLLVRDLLAGTRRFQDLETSLQGIAPNILSDRLKLMEEHGLVTRRLYSDHPPRAEYTLTDKGRGLGVVVGALAYWGSEHVFKRAKLVHTECGHPVKLGYHCPECGERVRGGAVALDPPRAAPRSRQESRSSAASRPSAASRSGRSRTPGRSTKRTARSTK